MFYGCKSLIELPDISKWNTENINNLSNIFYDCISLKSIPDISKWNISKVKNISGLFYNCINLNKLPNISIWNTSEVKEINNIFTNCKSLISLPDISKWNLKNVDNKSYISNIFDSSIKSGNNSLYKFSSSFNNDEASSHSEEPLNEKTENIKFNDNYENNEYFEDLKDDNFYKYYQNFYD